MADKDKARYERVSIYFQIEDKKIFNYLWVFLNEKKILFLQEMTAYKKKMKDGTGVAAVAKKEQSEEEWEDEDE